MLFFHIQCYVRVSAFEFQADVHNHSGDTTLRLFVRFPAQLVEFRDRLRICTTSIYPEFHKLGGGESVRVRPRPTPCLADKSPPVCESRTAILRGLLTKWNRLEARSVSQTP